MFSAEERKVIDRILRMLAEHRVKLNESLESLTKLGIRAGELEREAESAYHDLRKLASEPKAVEKQLKRALRKKPAPVPAGQR